MDTVLATNQFTDAEVRRINYCRIYLQLVTISDLTTTEGDRIDPAILSGNRPQRQSASRLEWPRQERPSSREWTLWRSVVNKLWSDEAGKLHTALGPWLMPIHEQRQRHRSYLHGSTLYVKEEDAYRECQQLSAQRYGETQFTIVWDDVPSQARPVIAIPDEMYTCWRILAVTEVKLPEKPSMPVQLFEQYINSLDQWETALLQHMNSKRTRKRYHAVVSSLAFEQPVMDRFASTSEEPLDGLLALISENEQLQGWVQSADQTKIHIDQRQWGCFLSYAFYGDWQSSQVNMIHGTASSQRTVRICWIVSQNGQRK